LPNVDAGHDASARQAIVALRRLGRISWREAVKKRTKTVRKPRDVFSFRTFAAVEEWTGDRRVYVSGQSELNARNARRLAEWLLRFAAWADRR
jgi:uncharacterized protein with von Willebrand factor type A (vWA) domain